MRKYLQLAATLALPCLPVAADEIDDLCRDRWGVDYVMREHCIKEQRSARSRVIQGQQLSPDAELERARMEAISAWLRQRRLPFLHDEIAALAPTNRDAALYLECEARNRNFDEGTSRIKRVLSCLTEGAESQ